MKIKKQMRLLRKTMILLIVGFFLGASVSLTLNGLETNTVSIKEKGHREVTVHFSNLILVEQKEKIMVNLVGTNSMFLQKDHYIIPSKIETFTFPFGTEIASVTCTVKNINQKELTKELMVAPDPVLNSQSVKTNNAEGKQSVNTWYEYRSGCGLNGKDREIIVKVEIFPVQYYPEEDYINWAETIEIKIEYDTPSHVNASFDEKYDLIIITPTEFSDELNSLVTHKNNRGVSTRLVTLTDIYNSVYFPVTGRDNPEKIKYFIKNAIDNWETRFVLLVGGSEEFPTRETHVYVDYGDGDDELFVSDLYYADIYAEGSVFSSWDTNENNIFGEYDWGTPSQTDELDLYPDVYLGRLACTSGSDVTTCVDKIKTYENNEAYTKDWFTNLVVIGGDTSPNDEEDILEGEYVNQAVMDIMDDFVPTKCWASEGTLNTRSPINSAINSGAGFIDFSGHGNPSVWATHPFNNPDIWIPFGNFKNTHVMDLNNGDELPIVVTGACSVAKYNEKNDCFTWSFVANPNGGGIASVGPSSLSWGYDTSYAIQALGGKMQLELFKAYKDDGAYTFGEMWAKAISNYIDSRMDCGDYKTLEQWQPFGDPSLTIGEESLAPATPEPPEGPSSGNLDMSYSYSASTTDPDGDKISYLFDWDDGTFSEWTSLKNSGQTAFESHAWSSKGSYQIRVKAKDSHGVQSEWSEPFRVSMPKNKGTFLPFILKNILDMFNDLNPLLLH